MRLFVTGANGQLGHDVILNALRQGFEIISSDIQKEPIEYDEQVVNSLKYKQLDITDAQAVKRAIDSSLPDAVIHCAAWTAVDLAEDENNKQVVYSINYIGTLNMAVACKETGCKLLYLSTDYVFSGDGQNPWKPDEVNYAPLNEYGKSKLMGELAIRENMEKYFIVRISWVFGKYGKNFVSTMLSLAKKTDYVKVVDDQIGTPTYTYDLSKLLIQMVQSDKYGIYHASNEGGFISWYEFAKEIFTQAGIDMNIKPVTTEEYGISKAKRPYNSRLDKEKLTLNGFERLPNWKNAVCMYLDECRVE